MSVQVEHLAKRYGGRDAVRDLTFEIPAGSIFGFVGPNGAGKTTTLRMLAGLLAPTAGDARIAGRSVRRQPRDVQQAVGYLPDFFGVYEDLTVAEYLDFYAHGHGLPGARRPRLIDDLLQLVDLAPKRDDYVEALSRGMKQRLGLARCLVHDPPVLLLDEPASGLDPRSRVELREILRDLQEMGKTILLSSHILPELADLCSHLGIVDRGRMLLYGPVEQVLARVGTTRTLVVRARDRLAEVGELVRGWPGVVEVTLHPDRLVAEGAVDDDALAELLRALVQADLPVIEFRRQTSGLEDLFLAVTDRSEGC